MLPFFSEQFGNPASAHQFGKSAANAVNDARRHVAALLGAEPAEIAFTSGATESNNLVILGMGSERGRSKIVTTQTEHKSVLEPVRRLSELGFQIELLPVDERGRVNLDAAQATIDNTTLLVSIQAANNEIGTVQPVKQIVELGREVGALIHCDAAQIIGKLPFSLSELAVDFASVSAHKLYGPKGVGALYVRGGVLNSPLTPLFRGGGQEAGARPGTLNVAAIVGFGRACQLSISALDQDSERIAGLRDCFESTLAKEVTHTSFNGDPTSRLPNCSSALFKGIRADELLSNCPRIAASIGSACTSGTFAPSHVLIAIGLSQDEANSTVRFSFGRQTTREEIESAVQAIAAAAATLMKN